MNQQESVTANLEHITSNPGPLLPTPVLWFQISRGDLIIMPLIMVMLRFSLESFQLNLTLNQVQIQTPLKLNKLMMMKWTISCNSSIHNMMMVFWVLNSRCFRLYCCLPLLKKIIQSLLCCFIKV